jgi:hypothetical protein
MTDTSQTEQLASKDSIVSQCLATLPTEWSPNIMAIFVDRLEYALFEERKGKLVAVGEQLQTLMHHVLAGAPDSVRDTILHDKGDPAIRLAFLLGNLSFAHQFASTTAHRRPDDAFFAAFDDPVTKKIVVYMLQGERTRTEISAATELEKKDIVRKMGELTALGIVDFRRRFGAGDADDVIEYFLTPAAKHMAGAAS